VPSVVRGRTLRRMSRLEWAAAHAAEPLSQLPGRWLHTEGVVGRARRVSEAMAEEGEMLVAAAYLHDIGYAPTLARTGFHPLDGAVHLRELGEERFAGLVAYHSGRRWRRVCVDLGTSSRSSIGSFRRLRTRSPTATRRLLRMVRSSASMTGLPT
jgi:hypothetical protein